MFIRFAHYFIPSTLNRAWHTVGICSSCVGYVGERPDLRFLLSLCWISLSAVVSYFQNDGRHGGPAGLNEETEAAHWKE